MINYLIEKGKQFYHHFPKSLRFLFWPVEKISWWTKALSVNVWFIIGEEKFSKKKLSILYGGVEENKNYLLQLAFDNAYTENYIGSTKLWNISNILKNKKLNCSLLICEVPKILRLFSYPGNCFYVPCWIDGEVDTTHPIRSDSFKTDGRRIRKNRLSYEITTSPAQLHNFYFNMHIPYVTKTFGAHASFFQYNYIEREFGQNGRFNELLLIKKGNDYVAGILMGYIRDVIYLYDIGVKNGNSELVSDGVIGALNYFPVKHAIDKGYKKVNFGLSRPFVNDGVLQFKKKRGMHLGKTSQKCFHIRLCKDSEGVRDFLSNNPFIYLDKMKLNTALFSDNNHILSQNDFDKIYKRFYIKGISKILFYQFGKLDKMAKRHIPKEYYKRFKLIPAKNLF